MVMVLGSEVFSVRTRRELKDIVRKYRDVDWRRLVEELIEGVAASRELEEALNELDELLEGLPPSPEPAWKSVREDREAI